MLNLHYATHESLMELEHLIGLPLSPSTLSLYLDTQVSSAQAGIGGSCITLIDETVVYGAVIAVNSPTKVLELEAREEALRNLYNTYLNIEAQWTNQQ